MAETGNAIDGDQLATMMEAVEEINWPADFYVPSDRKELIEQCLELDPKKRPADMREVWARIQHLDQQAVVKKARRLNTIFATLLVVAIWASGFAFVQAQKAKTATEKAEAAMNESRESAAAAMDLISLFVRELNSGEISGAEADQLYQIVADNASTFVENRKKNSPESTKVLYLAAQTAFTSAIGYRKRGNLDGALKEFTAAYEIHSELAGDRKALETLPVNLQALTARALMEIGKIYEFKENYVDAIAAFTNARDWRLKDSGARSGQNSLRKQRDRELAQTYRAISRAYSKNGEEEPAIEALEELHLILEEKIADSEGIDADNLIIEAIQTLRQKGETEHKFGDLDAASATFQRLMVLAESLVDASPSVAEEGRDSYIAALNSLGRIQLEQEQPEAALVLFREEIKLREERSSLRPYDPEIKVALAEAYSLAARALELENESSRSLANFYLEQAITLIGRLPSEVRYRPDVQANVINYNEILSTIQEMDE